MRQGAKLFLVAAAGSALLALPQSAGAGAAGSVRACTGSQLSGTFKEVQGSAGAGSITYRLTARNKSSRTCYLKGRPGMRLLGRSGTRLPTTVTADAGVPRKVVIAGGQSAHALARFSPSIAGTGDSQSGRCQPVAYRAKVLPRPGGGVYFVKLSPRTSVCERGRLALRPFHS